MTIHIQSNLFPTRSIITTFVAALFGIIIGCETSTHSDSPKPIHTHPQNPAKSNSSESEKSNSSESEKSDSPESEKSDSPESEKPDSSESEKSDSSESEKSNSSESEKSDSSESEKSDSSESEKSDSPESEKSDSPESEKSNSSESEEPDPQDSNTGRSWASLDNDLYQNIKKLGSTTDLSRLEEGGLSLFGDSLILSATEKHFEKDHPLTYHMHVGVAFPKQGSASFDVCSPGIGETKQLGRSRAITHFVNHALGPILSVVKHWPVRGAKRFWPKGKWGFSDFIGFVGPLKIRGEFDKSKLVNSRLWSDIPGLPRDGHIHLLKLQLEAAAGKWRRTIELDGHKPLVENEPWRKIRAPLGFTSVSQFALLTGLDPVSSIEVRKKAIMVLESASDWLETNKKCLADNLPDELVGSQAKSAVCQGGRLLDCVYACKMEVGEACYNAAVDIKYVSHKSRLAQMLFYRSCLLGHASGCTNATAARTKGKRDVCSTRTFKLVCEKASDPWACTMYAYALSENRKKTKADVQSIYTAIKKACKRGPQEPACKFAIKLKKKL